MLARLADERPDNLRFRLDLAAVLFQLGRDEDAEELFRELRGAPDLPPEVRREVDGYLADIHAREAQEARSLGHDRLELHKGFPDP